MPIHHAEDLDLFLDLWNANTPTRELANRFGLTRSGVLGYVNRLRAKRPGEVKSRPRFVPLVPKVSVPKLPSSKLPSSKLPSSKLPTPETPTPASTPDDDNPEGYVYLLDLLPHQCRFPVALSGKGLHLFCGQQRNPNGMFPSYCDRHADLAANQNRRLTVLGRDRLLAVRAFNRDNNDRD